MGLKDFIGGGKRVDRESHGRSKIGDFDRTNSFSRRASNGLLSVQRRQGVFCPVCGHDRVLVGSVIVKCSRCKHVFER